MEKIILKSSHKIIIEKVITLYKGYENTGIRRYFNFREFSFWYKAELFKEEN